MNTDENIIATLNTLKTKANNINSNLQEKINIITNVEENEDENGVKIALNIEANPNDYLFKQNENQKDKQQKKEYTPIKSYKPSGNLLYGDDILNKIENKIV